MVYKLVIASHVNHNITIHSFRRSFATFHHRKGTPIESIQILMGHKSIKTTQRYIILNEFDLIKASTPLSFITEDCK